MAHHNPSTCPAGIEADQLAFAADIGLQGAKTMTTTKPTRKLTAAQRIAYARSAVSHSTFLGGALVMAHPECREVLEGMADFEADGVFHGGDVERDRVWRVEVRS